MRLHNNAPTSSQFRAPASTIGPVLKRVHVRGHACTPAPV